MAKMLMAKMSMDQAKVEPITWRKYLQELEQRHKNYITENSSTKMTGLQVVNELMQIMYPGPYRVVEKYLPDRIDTEFSLEFSDPKEQTMWLLKNS